MSNAIATLTKEELRRKIDGGEKVQVVNVLAPEYYRMGIIPGSIKIPLAELDQRAGELDRSKEVITYCASTECPASRKAAEALAAKGFNVRAYEGGIKEWTAAGFPTEASARSQAGTGASPDQAAGLTGMGSAGV